MKEMGIKMIMTGALMGLSAYLGELLIPLAILLVVVCIDYITGMVGAWINQELSSKKGIKGIVKKLSYFLVVAVGMVVDWLIYSGLGKAGVEIDGGISVIALLVTTWIIVNELISILENVDKIGIPIPSFLSRIISKLKSSVDNKMNEQ